MTAFRRPEPKESKLLGQTSLVHAFTLLSGTSACSRASRSPMLQETTANNFSAVSHSPWAGRD